jgi:hypothetical protein
MFFHQITQAPESVMPNNREKFYVALETGMDEDIPVSK